MRGLTPRPGTEPVPLQWEILLPTRERARAPTVGDLTPRPGSEPVPLQWGTESAPVGCHRNPLVLIRVNSFTP